MNRVLNLLQVEDSESDAALVVRELERAGHKVHAERVETAPRMRAALQAGSWDAIIADYHLPQFDAPAALAILRKSGLDIPFLVVSGAVGEERAAAMMKAGAHDYVMKSNLARLAPAVEREIQEAQVRLATRQAAKELLAAQRETERSHQLLDAVFTAQTDALLVFDTTGTVVRSNPAAWSILGFEPAGMTIASVLDNLGIPPGPGASATALALAGKTGAHVEHSTAERTFESSAMPMRDATGRIVGAVTIIRDVTARKQAEQRLEQAKKLESIALLAGGIAHDFNNILTVVSGNISLALEESCPDCETRSILPAALDAVGRAARLTRQLLAYAGKGTFLREAVSVAEVGRKVVETTLPVLRRGVSLSAEFATDLPPLTMDPGQMEQLFSNLIANALEAIPDGMPGIITVAARFEGDAIHIEVADNGTGMDAETQKRIFDPFFTTKFQGRGLGLAAVDGIVRSLNGRITVGSTIGLGTSVELVLPARRTVAPEPVAAAAAPAPAAAANGKYGAVLVVDDEPMIRALAAALLRRHGIPVLEAGNGKEAVDRLAHEGAQVRAVLLDMAMPEMSGDVALPIIRKLRPDVRVIVSSGYHDSDIEQRLRHIAECSFLSKPYTREKLLAEILPAVRLDARGVE